jgi:hypothetical protein
VVRIQTSRRVLGLLDGAGQTLAEVAADHVSAEPAGGSAASWEEIEAELVTGGPELLTAIDTRLRRAGARPAATATKLQRALAGRLPAAGAARRPGINTTFGTARCVAEEQDQCSPPLVFLPVHDGGAGDDGGRLDQPGWAGGFGHRVQRCHLAVHAGGERPGRKPGQPSGGLTGSAWLAGLPHVTLAGRNHVRWVHRPAGPGA